MLACQGHPQICCWHQHKLSSADHSCASAQVSWCSYPGQLVETKSRKKTNEITVGRKKNPMYTCCITVLASLQALGCSLKYLKPIKVSLPT